MRLRTPSARYNSAGVALYAQSSGVQLGYDKDGNGVNDFLPARNAPAR